MPAEGTLAAPLPPTHEEVRVEGGKGGAPVPPFRTDPASLASSLRGPRPRPRARRRPAGPAILRHTARPAVTGRRGPPWRRQNGHGPSAACCTDGTRGTSRPRLAVSARPAPGACALPARAQPAMRLHGRRAPPIRRVRRPRPSLRRRGRKGAGAVQNTDPVVAAAACRARGRDSRQGLLAVCRRPSGCAQLAARPRPKSVVEHLRDALDAAETGADGQVVPNACCRYNNNVEP